METTFKAMNPKSRDNIYVFTPGERVVFNGRSGRYWTVEEYAPMLTWQVGKVFAPNRSTKDFIVSNFLKSHGDGPCFKVYCGADSWADLSRDYCGG